MIIMNEQPLSLVEREGKDFVRVVQPMFHNPYCITATRDYLELYNEEKQTLKKKKS